MKGVHGILVVGTLLGAGVLHAAHASPMLNLAWSEISFTTESGCQVHIEGDREGHIKIIRLRQNGKLLAVPKAAYQGIMWGALDEVRLFETPGYDELRLDIPAYAFDPESGNPTSKRIWSLVFRHSTFRADESGPGTLEPPK